MKKVNKKEIKSILDAFCVGTGLKVENNKTYFLSSNYGVIKVVFDLDSDHIPTIFTKLAKASGINSRGFNPYSGKRNYHGLDAIYNFLNYDIVVDDIIRDDDLKVAKIQRSKNSSLDRPSYDISISKNNDLIKSVACISYGECLRTAANLEALVA